MAALSATLLASAASFMLTEARSARAASAESYRLMRAELKADELLALAIVRLDSGDALAPQGALFEDEHGGRVLRQDAAGLVDVNAAEPPLLTALFAGLGLELAHAAMLADRIADWRDEDDLKRVHGAERAEYESAGAPPPENRPFQTEGEIARVLGMTPALAACALPYLTTYSGQADIDPAAAPPALMNLLGRSPEANHAQAAPFGRVIILTAEAPLSDQAALRRTHWLRLTGDPERPTLIHRGAYALARRASSSASCAGAQP